MIKFLILLFIFIAIFLIATDLGWTYNKCPPNQVIYKFIPRTFAENQDNPIPLDDIMGKMFSDPSPWVAQFNSNLKIKKINDQFVGIKY